jgi:hypothetical protein
MSSFDAWPSHRPASPTFNDFASGIRSTPRYTDGISTKVTPMPRFKALRDWPACLQHMTLEELTRERTFWARRLVWLKQQPAREETRGRVRDVTKAIEARQAVSAQGPSLAAAIQPPPLHPLDR